MKYARLLSAVAALVVLTACDRQSRALGDANTIVIIAADSLWEEVGDSVLAALEPRVYTTRPERIFQAEQISPMDQRWTQLRGFTQVIAIGQPGDSWITEAVESVPGQLPAIVETEDVWSRGQRVTAIVVDPASAGAGVLAQVDSVGRAYESRFQRATAERMYASGTAVELQDSLAATAGYSIALPNVYRTLQSEPVRRFRTQSNVGGVLVRSLLIDEREGGTAPDADGLVAWRDSIATEYYTDLPQTTQQDTLIERTLPGGGIEVQGVWRSTDASFPEAGVFVARAVPCPARDRVYLLDAWVLAPGRNKVEYVYQFNTILDSFECASAR